MIFLVDFENTHASGFDGYHYLTEQDTLVVYYSDENSALQRGVVEDLKEKAVHVRMVKLLKQHSNALDMYIASTTGMFLDTGEKICIVSKDKGYAAVRDFWHSLRGAEILLGETIEECFLHSVTNDDERIRRAKERNQKVQLIDAFETTNNVPTRPTLSYRNNYRRRKNNFLDVNSHLDPVELLPNPLAKEDVSYASLVEEEKDGEHFHVDYSTTIKEEKLLPDAENVDAIEQEASSPMEAEGNALHAEENHTAQEEESREESVKPGKEQGEQVESEHHKETVNRIYPKTEKKVNTGRPSNQIQYIYDPVLKRMKRVDVEDLAEDHISEAKLDESKRDKVEAVEAEKQSEIGSIESSQENNGNLTAENHPTDQAKERSRHHNRRRRRSNAKRDNVTQETGQNHSQEAEKSATKPVKEEKKQSKTSEKQSKSSEKQEGNKAENQSVKAEKEEKATKDKPETKSSSSKSVSKSSTPKSAKSKTEEEKTAKLTEKATKTKVETKASKEKVEEKTAKPKVEEKTSKAKVEEKSSKAKPEENKSKTKAEKEPKAKNATKASEEKSTVKSGKAKAEDKKEEKTATQKPSRRGRKKKEETNSSEN